MGRTVTSDPNVIALPASPTGFTAGDYVYQTRTGYGSVPSGALATGNFNASNVAVPIFASTATTSNQFTYVEQLGGSTGSQTAALLNNGNIVYVYASGNVSSGSSTPAVNFRIETTAGSVVVAETSTTMTVQSPFQASVVALPNGGFCVVCTPGNASTFNLNARFYNADGTTATAVLNASLTLTLAAQVGRLKLAARSDSSVIIGYNNGSSVELRRVATTGFDGAFGTAGVTTIFTGTSQQCWDYILDSSNNIHTIHLASSSSVVMRRYNSSGVQQTTSTVSSITGTVSAVAAVITSDSTIRGFAQTLTAGIRVITWDGTTAALGTQIITTSSTDGAALGAFAQGASGGYVLIYSSLTAQNTNPLNVQAFNSSNVSLATAATLVGAQNVNYRTQFVPIVVSGDTRIYFGVFQAALNNLSTGSSYIPPMGVAYFAYNNTSYALLNTTTVNQNFTGLGPFALGAYARGSSTAASARFSIASTGTYTANVAAGTTSISKTFVDGTNTTGLLALAPLANGEFVAAWARTNGATYPTFISKYSATGALQVGPVTVAASGFATSHFAVGVATFANGNIFVCYAASASVLSFVIYTPSLTVVTSGTVSNAVNITTNSGNIAVATFGAGTHVAIAFPDSSGYFVARTVSNAGVVSATLFTLTDDTRWYNVSVIGLKSSAFIASAVATVGPRRAVVVRQTAASTFVPLSPFDYNAVDSYSFSARLTSPMPAVGTAAYMVGNNSANLTITNFSPTGNASNQLIYNVLPTPFSGSLTGASDFGAGVGYTGTGTPVVVSNRNNSGRFLTFAPIAGTMNSNGGTLTLGGVFTTTLATTSSAPSGIAVIPGIGENVIVGYVDDNNYPAFVSFYAAPYAINVTLTAGVDISTSALALTPESGYSLQGISVTGASSGSSGLVQTRGSATLNSNYSAATTATTFDFRNPLSFGTYGTIIGRNVIMGN